VSSKSKRFSQKKIADHCRETQVPIRYAIYYKELGQWRVFDIYEKKATRNRFYKWLTANNPDVEMRRVDV
jgi:hypothetical protein